MSDTQKGKVLPFVTADARQQVKELGEKMAAGGINTRIAFETPPDVPGDLRKQRWFYGDREDTDWLRDTIMTQQDTINELRTSLDLMLKEQEHRTRCW